MQSRRLRFPVINLKLGFHIIAGASLYKRAVQSDLETIAQFTLPVELLTADQKFGNLVMLHRLPLLNFFVSSLSYT